MDLIFMDGAVLRQLGRQRPMQPARGSPRRSVNSTVGKHQFRRIANGLGGGSGWVILGYNRQFGTAENYWMADHAHSPATTVPLLVMDMYEHSYHMDFGSAAGQYVDAFFNNINWETVLERIEALRT
jgi:superoxide dismutase